MLKFAVHVELKILRRQKNVEDATHTTLDGNIEKLWVRSRFKNLEILILSCRGGGFMVEGR